MVELVEWEDVSVFKAFCLDRLAVGLPAEAIASDISVIIGRTVPVEQVSSSCSNDEVSSRRKELIEEVRASSPNISRDLLYVMGKVKKFMRSAESAFENSDKRIEDFDAYRRSMELQLKALEVASSQINKLSEQAKAPPAIVVQFNLSDLQRLESSGAIKVVDVDLAGELLGESKETQS